MNAQTKSLCPSDFADLSVPTQAQNSQHGINVTRSSREYLRTSFNDIVEIRYVCTSDCVHKPSAVTGRLPRSHRPKRVRKCPRHAAAMHEKVWPSNKALHDDESTRALCPTRRCQGKLFRQHMNDRSEWSPLLVAGVIPLIPQLTTILGWPGIIDCLLDPANALDASAVSAVSDVHHTEAW